MTALTGASVASEHKPQVSVCESACMFVRACVHTCVCA